VSGITINTVPVSSGLQQLQMVPLTTVTFEVGGPGGNPGVFDNRNDGDVIGPWTIVKKGNAGIHLLWVFNNNQYFPQYVPGGYTYALWIQVSGQGGSGINGATTTFNVPTTVGNPYSVSFWYVARANGQPAPPYFQVTLGGTVVWNTSPTSLSWVRKQPHCRTPLCEFS